MLDPLDFGRKEIKHKKFQFLLVFLGLVICVASTVFLISLGQSLGFTVFSKSTRQFTAAISNTISKYISFESTLIFLTGMLTIYFLLSSLMAERIRDIGLVKAIGYIDKHGFSHLMSAPLLVIVSACSVGGLIGFFAFTAIAIFSFHLGFSSIIIGGIVVSFGIVLLSILLSWEAVARQTNKAFKLASANLLSGDRSYFDFEKEQIGLVKKVAERLSPSIEIVLKSMFRSRSRSKTALICLSASILLITVSFVGGFLCWDTSRSYADRAIGQNVLAIGDSILINKYISLMDPNANANDPELQSFNFTSSKFILNETFVERLGSVQGITVVDTRLVTFTQVAEVQNITAELDWITREAHYVIIGDHRSADCVVVGVDPAHLVSSGLTQRTGALNTGNYDEAVIGDSLSEAIFQDPYRQSIKVFSNKSANDSNFNIVNVMVDPLNHGYVVYVPVSSLRELNSVDGFNLVLVKINELDNEVASEITSLAAQYSLAVSNLDSVRNQYATSIDGIWFSVLPFTMLSAATATIGLLNSMSVSVSGRIHDFGVLRALGAKPNYLIKMVFLECLIFVLVTAPIGIIIGTVVAILFLVPSPTISASFLVISLLSIAVTLFGMCGLSTLIVMRMRKQLPSELMQETE